MFTAENSKWIWFSNDLKAKDQMAYIRKEFPVPTDTAGITLYITASTRYKVFIDGESIGIGPCPGDPKLYYYDTYDIPLSAASAGSGRMCLSAVCYSLGEDTEVITGQNKGLAGFRCLVRMETKGADGSAAAKTAGSDETFKAIAAPTKPGDFVRLDESRTSKWGGFKEIFDSRKEPEGWKLCGFDDSGWADAVIAQATAEQFSHLTPREIPFMTDYSVRPKAVLQVEKYNGDIRFPERILEDGGIAGPVLIDASVPGSFPALVLDFGREVVGYPSYTLRGMSGANVSFWYGESLDMYRYDTVILSGETITYKPYHLRAFRYLRIVFNNSLTPVELSGVSLRVWRFPYKDRGSFACSDELLNRIWQTSIYTVQMNSLEHFVDCPLREQAQWLADSRVMAMSNYWAFYSPELVRKAIRQFLAVQNEAGFIPATGPQDCTLTNMDFPCHFFKMVHEYYFYTMDLAFLSEVYAALGRLLAFYESAEDSDGFTIDRFRKGYFLDWAFIDKRGQVTAAQCLYHQAIIAYSEIAVLTGHTDEAQRLRTKADALKLKINTLLYDADRGLYCDCRVDGRFSEHYSQQSTAYALVCGVAPEEQRPQLIRAIFEIEGIEQIKGAFLLSFVTGMLFRNGCGDRSIDLIRDYWGEMLKRGATTWWETFDRQSPFTAIPYCFAGNSPTYLIEYIPSSHCHAWGSGPAHVLPAHILGIQPLEPGFACIAIHPYAGDLQWCEGHIPTKSGMIHARWEKAPDGRIRYTALQLPEGIQIVDVADGVTLPD